MGENDVFPYLVQERKHRGQKKQRGKQSTQTQNFFFPLDIGRKTEKKEEKRGAYLFNYTFTPLVVVLYLYVVFILFYLFIIIIILKWEVVWRSLGYIW